MKTKFSFSLTGFIVAMLLASMLAVSFAIMLSSLGENYDLNTENGSLGKYNYTSQLVTSTELIGNKTNEVGNTDSGIIDRIGAFFENGWVVLTTAKTSVNLFSIMIDDASEDIPPLAYFKEILIAIVFISLH